MRVAAASLLALTLIAAPASAQQAPANRQIDYPGFAALVGPLGQVRAAHRLDWRTFRARAGRREALLLDARSADAFARGHLKGAVNLPFTDFTDEALARVIGPDRSRPIYIYCNNNFADNRDPVVTKRAPMALNIPTFINLHGYGYANVWELADVVMARDIGDAWVSGATPFVRPAT